MATQESELGSDLVEREGQERGCLNKQQQNEQEFSDNGGLASFGYDIIALSTCLAGRYVDDI